MSKKTRRTYKKYTKRHRKHKIHGTHKRHRRHKRRLLPNTKGIILFTIPEKHHVQKILVNQNNQTGNMIPGLRNM
jgi:hypothetical protein